MGGRHRLASGGRARAAAIYPFQLCKAILRGFRNQLRSDGRLVQGVCGLQSLEWEEARVLHWDELPEEEARALHWDELPEASAESLESAMTRCLPKRPPKKFGASAIPIPKTSNAPSMPRLSLRLYGGDHQRS